MLRPAPAWSRVAAMTSHAELLQDLVAAARRAGADAADALLVASASLSVQRRLGKIEQLERAEGFDLGLRVFLGQRQAIVSSTDPSPRGFEAASASVIQLAEGAAATSASVGGLRGHAEQVAQQAATLRSAIGGLARRLRG